MIKLSRQDNPWGRDIIEAMASARAVIATGTWSGFVGNDETGFLIDDYRPGAVASLLAQLAQNGASDVTRLGTAPRSHIPTMCGPERATELTNIWCDLAAAGRL
jgi:hypothetical protein